MSFLRHGEPHQADERLLASDVLNERARPFSHAPAHRADESPVGCSWRVALQHCPIPLNQPRLIVGERSVERKNFFLLGPMGLNFLSHYRGAPQSQTKLLNEYRKRLRRLDQSLLDYAERNGGIKDL